MNDERKWWLDEPKNQDKIYYGLWIACILVTLADLFYHKHGYFHFEEWTGFHSIFGFLACAALILLAKQLRRVVGRSEDYYDR
jgi:hypothetical protein